MSSHIPAAKTSKFRANRGRPPIRDRFEVKATSEESLRLEVHRLCAFRYLRPNLDVRGHFEWEDAEPGGSPIRIAYHMTTGESAGSLKIGRQRIPLETVVTSPTWTILWTMLCPGCGRRARVLFFPPGQRRGEARFGCRACARICYLGQQCGRSAWYEEHDRYQLIGPCGPKRS